MFVITGCPVSVDFPLGTPGTEKIDKDMIGKWIQTDTDKEVLKMEITKIDNYSVKLVVAEKGGIYAEDADTFIGWFTELDGKKFIYLRAAADTEADYYTYCYQVNGNTFKSYDVSLLVGGVDAVTSTNAYRLEVSKSLKMEGSLTGEAVWTKE